MHVRHRAMVRHMLAEHGIEKCPCKQMLARSCRIGKCSLFKLTAVHVVHRGPCARSGDNSTQCVLWRAFWRPVPGCLAAGMLLRCNALFGHQLAGRGSLSKSFASRSSVSDYECDFGGMLPSPPPALSSGHSGAWAAAVVSSTVGGVALLAAVLVIIFSCMKLRRRGAVAIDKSFAGASSGPSEDRRTEPLRPSSR